MMNSYFSLFLTYLWIGFVSCAVYHIIPSRNHSCPVESCLTLSSFAISTSLYLDSNTSLIFQPGNHTVHSGLIIKNVATFSMTSYSTKQSSTGIICDENSSRSDFIFETVDHVHISSLNFYGCECNNIEFALDIASITVIESNLVLLECIFKGYKSTSMITANHSNITIMQCIFRDNLSVLYYSDGILLYSYSNVMFVNSTFINNEGRIMDVKIRGLDVVPTIARDLNSLIIIGCEFRNNYNDLGAIISVENSAVSIMDTKFINNIARSLFARRSNVYIDKSDFKYNHGSVINLVTCTVDVFKSVYESNQGGFSRGGAALTSNRAVIHIHGSEFKNNVAKSRGGAIYCVGESLISFNETCTLTYNHAERGGAVYIGDSVQCFVEYGATVIIANNTASNEGGGVYLDQLANLTLHSHSTLQIIENRATESGGGIYVSKLSSINVAVKSHDDDQTSNSIIYLHKNQASKGGGLYLGFNSTVRTFTCLKNTINFDENSADYGGAVYVFSDLSTGLSYPECFFQSLPHPAPMQNIGIDKGNCSKQDEFPFQFSLNSANYSGISLFKSVFDSCSINRSIFEEFTVLNTVSNVQTSDVGSFLVQACFCGNSNPDCTKQLPFIDIKTGENVIIDVAIADRGNHIVNGSIESEIRGSVLIRDDQKIQHVKNGCTPLIFNIYSFEASQQLIMSPQLEKDSMYISSKRSIQLNFLACIDCPIGFQKMEDDAKGCDCVCNVILRPYIISCNYSRETITKRGTTAWISYLSIKNTSGYLIYPYCPMDYCLPPDTTVKINLSIPNGADAQCAHDRSGLLCGACSPGLSLSLGSSHCLPCHAHWPGLFVTVIISSLLAGIILVASLLVLNLTVAVGTLNGLIFYANIVATNQDRFFHSTSFITVFVSWLNLELGIDTCFFDGMDFYWKTWIELAFPTYILLLVVLVIIISECSVKFAQIVGKRNPLATLDTLILLCYVKFVRTVILAFSFATLDYPDNSHPVVWWPDATVGYFNGKHIVLWVVAALIFVASLFYTVLLFSWQWLLYYQHKMIFKWVQSQRLRMFVEPYHAPYAFKHRYWTGLLLLVRVFVHIISASNVSGDRGITILAIGITVNILLILISCRPYKSWPVEFLEIICYANIIGLCLATLYISKVGNSQDVVGYISGTITLVLFLIVLTYHVVTQLFLKTQLGKKVKNRLNRQFNDAENEDQVSLVTHDNEEGKPATYSEVDPPPRRDAVPLSYFVNLRNTTDSVLGSRGCEENELRLREQAINGPTATPYSLMK